VWFVCVVLFLLLFLWMVMSVKLCQIRDKAFLSRPVFFYITRKTISKRLCFMHLTLTHINRKPRKYEAI